VMFDKEMKAQRQQVLKRIGTQLPSGHPHAPPYMNSEHHKVRESASTSKL
jgi:hypothetical protein